MKREQLVRLGIEASGVLLSDEQAERLAHEISRTLDIAEVLRGGVDNPPVRQVFKPEPVVFGDTKVIPIDMGRESIAPPPRMNRGEVTQPVDVKYWTVDQIRAKLERETPKLLTVEIEGGVKVDMGRRIQSAVTGDGVRLIYVPPECPLEIAPFADYQVTDPEVDAARGLQEIETQARSQFSTTKRTIQTRQPPPSSPANANVADADDYSGSISSALATFHAGR